MSATRRIQRNTQINIKERKTVSQINNDKRLQQISKQLTTLIILFTILPILVVLYLQLLTIKTDISGGVMSLIQNSPSMSIVFLISMIHPLIAFILIKVKEKINDISQINLIYHSMIILLIECLFMNFLYAAFMIYFIYKIMKLYQLKLFHITNQFSLKVLWKETRFSFIIVALACLCLWMRLHL